MYRVVFFVTVCCNTVKSTWRPLVGGGQRSGVRRGARKIFGAPLKTFFVCLFVKSPLWPQGTSARLIPGLPGVEGKEGVRGSKV